MKTVTRAGAPARDATQDVDITPVSWTPTRKLSFEEWSGAGLTLQEIRRSLNWWLGDWIIYGMENFGESYAQAIELHGHELEALKKYVWVARNVPRENRRPALSWTHHMHVGACTWDDQRAYLDYAVEYNLTSSDLKDYLPHLAYAIDKALTFEELKRHIATGLVYVSSALNLMPDTIVPDPVPVRPAQAQEDDDPDFPYSGSPNLTAPAQLTGPMVQDPEPSTGDDVDLLIDNQIGGLKDSIFLPRDPVQAAHKLSEDVDQAWLSTFLHELVNLIQ